MAADLPVGLRCLLTHNHGHGAEEGEAVLTNRQKRRYIYKVSSTQRPWPSGKAKRYLAPDLSESPS